MVEASELLLQPNLFTPDSSDAVGAISKMDRRNVRLAVLLFLLVSSNTHTLWLHTHTHTHEGPPTL